jgi:hypothetical protein
MRLGEEVEGKRVESRVAIVQFLSPRGPLSLFCKRRPRGGIGLHSIHSIRVGRSSLQYKLC